MFFLHPFNASITLRLDFLFDIKNTLKPNVTTLTIGTCLLATDEVDKQLMHIKGKQSAHDQTLYS